MSRSIRSPLLAVAVLCCALAAAIADDLPAQQPAHAETPRTLRVDGVERDYLLYLPTTYRRGQPVPLVLVFHAGGGRARGIAPHTGFSRLAEREGFVVAYPEGLDRRWNDGRAFATAAHDDVGFVRALLDTLERELDIDPRRIYATGISNGAMFSYRLACDLPGIFAAVAPVAGATPADLAPACARTGPVSVLAIQGTGDPLMPYAGGGTAHRRVLSAERSIALWAGVNGCGSEPVAVDEPDRVTDGTRVRRSTYEGCQEGRAVELRTIVGGGHTWPGGPAAGRSVGRVSRELDATAVIWRFFVEHPKP
ncbi:MAG TPA: PHB depolymerase family esterase [Gemmatimonadales bacterium]|nr:PHB depolymerase family esterase [Gemmatimonadales bacterium]